MVGSIAIASVFTLLSLGTNSVVSNQPAPQVILSQKEFSLDDRYPVPSVNEVFKENILLTLAYMDGKASKGNVSWDEVNKPFHYEFSLETGKTFAFQDEVLPEFSDKVAKTTTAHFSGDEGFISDGYLYGDGVCHLASFIDVVAKQANLEVLAPTNHDFANIPEVARDNGVAIYADPSSPSEGAEENLYVTNNQPNPVKFDFDYDGHNLNITILK